MRGDRRGHELGFPTANLSTPRFAAIPADGVYAGRFSLLNSAARPPLMAAVSVGTNPTFSGRERRVEAFVLDVDEDFYGQRVAVDFVGQAPRHGEVRHPGRPCRRDAPGRGAHPRAAST